MAKPTVFVTRQIPQSGIKLLSKKCKVVVSKKKGVLTRSELIKGIKNADAVLCLLTDKIDGGLMDTNSKIKVFANYAVGFDNIDVKAANKRGIAVTNTPGVLTDAVSEHAVTLICSIGRRVVESDKYVRAGKYKGWEPELLLGGELNGKTIGVLGSGRIGSTVLRILVKGFGMKGLYYDVARNPALEKELGVKFATVNDVLKKSDYVSVHVPLLPSTKHMISTKQLKMMKKTAYLVNTSRGPVIDEKALVSALKKKQIAGAALDVFEFEPKLSPGMNKLDNIIMTPHTASATLETRSKMSEIAAQNILAVLAGKKAPNLVVVK